MHSPSGEAQTRELERYLLTPKSIDHSSSLVGRKEEAELTLQMPSNDTPQLNSNERGAPSEQSPRRGWGMGMGVGAPTRWSGVERGRAPD